MFISVAPKFNSYAQKVADEGYQAHFYAETDISERDAELAQFW